MVADVQVSTRLKNEHYRPRIYRQVVRFETSLDRVVYLRAQIFLNWNFPLNDCTFCQQRLMVKKLHFCYKSPNKLLPHTRIVQPRRTKSAFTVFPKNIITNVIRAQHLCVTADVSRKYHVLLFSNICLNNLKLMPMANSYLNLYFELIFCSCFIFSKKIFKN